MLAANRVEGALVVDVRMKYRKHVFNTGIQYQTRQSTITRIPT
jgi:hypothetical protein